MTIQQKAQLALRKKDPKLAKQVIAGISSLDALDGFTFDYLPEFVDNLEKISKNITKQVAALRWDNVDSLFETLMAQMRTYTSIFEGVKNQVAKREM